MHPLWDFAWQSHPCQLLSPPRSAAPTQEHFLNGSVADKNGSQDGPLYGISLTLDLWWSLRPPDSAFSMSLEPAWFFPSSASPTQSCPISIISFPQDYYNSLLDSRIILYKSILHILVENAFQNKNLIMSFLCLEFIKDIPLTSLSLPSTQLSSQHLFGGAIHLTNISSGPTKYQALRLALRSTAVTHTNTLKLSFPKILSQSTHARMTHWTTLCTCSTSNNHVLCLITCPVHASEVPLNCKPQRAGSTSV